MFLDAFSAGEDGRQIAAEGQEDLGALEVS